MFLLYELCKVSNLSVALYFAEICTDDPCGESSNCTADPLYIAGKPNLTPKVFNNNYLDVEPFLLVI